MQKNNVKEAVVEPVTRANPLINPVPVRRGPAKLLYDRLRKIEETLGAKQREYAGEGDDSLSRFRNALHNFDRTAQIKNETPEKALWGMAVKHLTSILDMVEDPSIATEERVDEKIGDMINYMIILEWIFMRRIQNG